MMRRVLPWLLAVLLAVVVAAEVAWPDDAVVPPRPASPVAVAAPTLPPAGQATAWIGALLARPPFAPDRRPPASEPPAPGVVAELPRLAGILITGTSRSALFALDSGRSVVAQEGGQVAGYDIQSIRPDGVVLVGPEGTRSLRPTYLKTDGTAAPAEAPSPGFGSPGFPSPGFPNQPGPRNFGAPPTRRHTPVDSGASLGLLPPPPVTDTRPYNLMPSPSGAAIFSNAPNFAGARK